MKRILWIMVVIGIAQTIWGTSPKIAQPLEHAVIKTGKLFIFVEPTPADVEEKHYLQVEIYQRDSGELIGKRTISPSQNYKTSVSVKSWDSGKYLLKIRYVDKKGIHLTKSSWRNFTIE